MVVVGLQDGTLTTQTYAATGMRRKSQADAATTRFVWDARNVLLETDGDGDAVVLYTNGLGAYGPLVAQRRGGASIFHHFDALGSTTELTSAAAAVTDTYRYYAFGETRASTGTTTNPFGFVGRLGYYTEPTLDLQYLRARWYQPATGRFTSRDPLGRGAAYAYVSNDAPGSVDPSGMQQGAARCSLGRRRSPTRAAGVPPGPRPPGTSPPCWRRSRRRSPLLTPMPTPPTTAGRTGRARSRLRCRAILPTTASNAGTYGATGTGSARSWSRFSTRGPPRIGPP